jgi:cytochrome c553
MVNGSLRTAILIVLSFALGVGATRYYDVHKLRTQTPPLAAQPASAPTAAPVDLEHEPLWAYGFDKPAAPGEVAQPQAPPSRKLRPNEDPAEQTALKHLEGSNAGYSLVDIRDGQNVIDWFPKDHPPMPDVIQHGPVALGDTKRGCGSCHLPNGKGRPENAGVAGLPVSYIMRQIQDFRSGKRRSADPRKPNTNTMIELAKNLSDEELKAAAEYFAALPWTQWIRVVETDMVPKTRIVGNLFLPLEQVKSEPIGARIIEVPENEEQTETYRNPHVGFVAYVPPGSLSKGKDLVTTGGAKIVGNEFIPGKATPCITCHREDLMGNGDAPPIVGRSASYMAREMWDIQQGTRNGEPAQLMKLAIAKLTPDDLIAVAAYVSSLKPPSPNAAPKSLLTSSQ